MALAADRLNLPLSSVRATAQLLAQGATVPFISRYRKEVTGNLDEVAVRDIQLELERLDRLDKRREAIKESIESRGMMTPEIAARLDEATTLNALEDIYLPYRPKRRTRATAARELGLEPLARMIMKGAVPASAARRFIGEKVATIDEAIAGAADIIAEWASESQRVRQNLRRFYERSAFIKASVVKGREADADKYRSYFKFNMPARNVASHQYLALRRGEAEGLLKVSVEVDENAAVDITARAFIPASVSGEALDTIKASVTDSYKRLLRPSVENEMAARWKEDADRRAIELFSGNLRQLLMASPLRGHNVLAIDPGYRTGCKVVALDSSGNLLDDDIIYPNEPRRDTVHAMRTLLRLIDDNDIEAIALGDRTASRDTEEFLRRAGITDFTKVYIVSENGASVYSASDVAREEFPDKDVTVRGAVSIGRRLIDPLAELVKIDPKSIGVGQYQHDVDQSSLRDALDFTVLSCVNAVGVDLNTASARLLGYISGIGQSMARRIVDYRAEHGPFGSRRDLMKVPRLGAAIYEQAAGFLRVPDSENPLDNTGIHPESYAIAQRMAADLSVDIASLVADEELIDRINPARYAAAGVETVADIIAELRKPGRDPRLETGNVDFDPSVKIIDDIKAGMTLPGKVSNITAFGAFVDLGIKEHGLLHVSQMGPGRVTDPSRIYKINDIITVRVIDVDLDRHRISLSVKDL